MGKMLGLTIAHLDENMQFFCAVLGGGEVTSRTSGKVTHVVKGQSRWIGICLWTAGGLNNTFFNNMETVFDGIIARLKIENNKSASRAYARGNGGEECSEK